jgi:hypothetical protein
MFLQSLEDTELEEGEDLELKCQIMGAPLPQIMCYFTKDISEKSSIKRISSENINYNYETGICRVYFKNVSFNDNNGFYMIKALNEAGSLTTICQVKVKLKSFPPLVIDSNCAPSFIVELENEIKAMDGQEVVLNCVCKAKPEPKITWLRSTLENKDQFIPVKLTNDTKSTFDSLTGKCTFKINDAYPQDSGIFICSANNEYGSAETRTNLIIECNLKKHRIYIINILIK